MRDARLTDSELLASDVVANSLMNRERGLAGANSYTKELGFNPLERLLAGAGARDDPPAWLDVCCGSGRALHEAADARRTLDGGLEARLVGIDLVDLFDPRPDLEGEVELVCAPIQDWAPTAPFDLITCVHGLHYLGDKLGLLCRLASWLAPGGLLVADFDPTSIRLDDGRPGGRSLHADLRRAGFDLDGRKRRIRFTGPGDVTLPYRYLGADDAAGPNYTGQPAVHSYYARTTPLRT